jgi:hypothetical protein
VVHHQLRRPTNPSEDKAAATMRSLYHRVLHPRLHKAASPRHAANPSSSPGFETPPFDRRKALIRPKTHRQVVVLSSSPQPAAQGRATIIIDDSSSPVHIPSSPPSAGNGITIASPSAHSLHVQTASPVSPSKRKTLSTSEPGSDNPSTPPARPHKRKPIGADIEPDEGYDTDCYSWPSSPLRPLKGGDLFLPALQAESGVETDPYPWSPSPVRSVRRFPPPNFETEGFSLPEFPAPACPLEGIPVGEVEGIEGRGSWTPLPSRSPTPAGDSDSESEADASDGDAESVADEEYLVSDRLDSKYTPKPLRDVMDYPC